MNSIKMNRKELLDIVKQNATKHALDYNESVEDYKVAVLKLVKANLKLANTGELDQISRIKAVPQRPSNYSDNYSRAIRMLELSVEEIIDIEEDIFNQLVLDEWSWKQSFVTASAMYKSI